jgi:hypothetical protein
MITVLILLSAALMITGEPLLLGLGLLGLYGTGLYARVTGQ